VSRKPLVADRQMALLLGVSFFIAGAVLLYDAHEGRGRERPFWLRFLPT
jgi:hypothetical protein